MARGETKARDGVYYRRDRNAWYGSWKDAQGRRRQRKFDVSTLEQARAALAAEKYRVEEQLKFGRPLPSRESFSVFADEFLKYQNRRISSRVVKGKLSQVEYDRQAGIVEGHLKPFFGTMKLASVRRKDVAAYINSRMGEVGDGTIIKEVNTLKRLFNVAIELEKIEANPAHKAPLPKAPEGRVRYLSPEDWRNLFDKCTLYDYRHDENREARTDNNNLKALNRQRRKKGQPEEPLSKLAPLMEPTPLPQEEQWLKHFAALSLALGTRRGELLRTTWEDVSIPRSEIRLRQTKNGKERPAFINDLALQVLMSMSGGRLKGRGKLFPAVTPAQATTAFIRACKEAGIDDFSLHDLRHTFASHARMNGVDLHTLQKLLGHSDPRMTDRYAHLSQDHLLEAARKLDGVLTLPSATPEEEGSEDPAVGLQRV